MPTYDYECSRCGHTFDTFQSMSDAPLTKCPECGRNGLKRLIGGGLGVIFKGSGFYVTDSRSSGSKKSTTKTAAASADGTGEKTAAAASDGSAKSGGESGKESGGSGSGASEKVAG